MDFPDNSKTEVTRPKPIPVEVETETVRVYNKWRDPEYFVSYMRFVLTKFHFGEEAQHDADFRFEDGTTVAQRRAEYEDGDKPVRAAA